MKDKKAIYTIVCRNKNGEFDLKVSSDITKIVDVQKKAAGYKEKATECEIAIIAHELNQNGTMNFEKDGEYMCITRYELPE